jgi:hypothetical protein
VIGIPKTKVKRRGRVQAIQSNTIIKRHDAVPVVVGPVGLVAEADAADVTLD